MTSIKNNSLALVTALVLTAGFAHANEAISEIENQMIVTDGKISAVAGEQNLEKTINAYFNYMDGMIGHMKYLNEQLDSCAHVEAYQDSMASLIETSLQLRAKISGSKKINDIEAAAEEIRYNMRFAIDLLDNSSDLQKSCK